MAHVTMKHVFFYKQQKTGKQMTQQKNNQKTMDEYFTIPVILDDTILK